MDCSWARIEGRERLDRVLPLRGLLDPRPREDARARPIADAVSVPLGELVARLSELPPPGARLNVLAGAPESPEALRFLRRRGYRSELCDGTPGPAGAGRLWVPNALAELLAASAPSRLLDVGCGSGRDATALAALGWDVTAIDHLPDAIDRARLLAQAALGRSDGPHFRVGTAGEVAATWPVVMVAYGPLREALAHIMARVAQGGILAFEMFHPDHRTPSGGRPNPRMVVTPEEDPGLGEGWTRELAGESERADRRGTLQIWRRAA